MNLARVAGTVVATQKEASLTGAKLLILERLSERMKPLGDFVVAVDAVGAGEGEVVLYAAGSSARQTTITKERPVDAVIMAIVDSFTIGDETVFRK
ncbi:MAG: ethanolamine utilization protein EutN [Spirochaetaceae bacterium]|nr:MAG: ethanolamine utilization protein EutN [Spirochaetaceae bacterium]